MRAAAPGGGAPRSDASLQAVPRLACQVLDVPAALLCAVGGGTVAATGIDPAGLHGRAVMMVVAQQGSAPLVVPDAEADPRFALHPLVAGPAGFRFLAAAAVPDGVDGAPAGLLCVLDRVPRQPDAAWLAGFADLAVLAAASLRTASPPATDPLTGLASETTLLTRLAMPAPGDAALLLLDLDGFGGLNRVFGHRGGDRTLREVARRLRGVARPGDLAARLDGDTFALLRRGPEALEASAAELHEVLADPFTLDGHLLPLSVAVGAARLADATPSEPEALLDAADAALTAAKRSGHGGTRLYGPGDGAALPRGRRWIARALRSALLPGGQEPFTVHFQPYYSLTTGLPLGAEALVRWPQPDGGMLSPADFVPVAEETGLVAHLDRWVLSRACAAAAAWPAGLAVGVNLSAADFVLLDTVETVREVLAETGLPGSRLKVEVTEHVLLHDPVQVGRVIRALREMGVTVALDDFGAGHSSLTYLREFPFDTIKLDRSLVVQLSPQGAERARAEAIARAVVQLSHAIGTDTIAEGVDTPEQLRFLQGAGCTAVQGYLLCRPLPEERLAEVTLERPATWPTA